MNHHVASLKPFAFYEDEECAARLATAVDHLDLDCTCKGRLDDALRQFTRQERARRRERLILDARLRAAQIASLMNLLKEIADIAPGEPDQSVFPEIAYLFDDVAEAARRGAADLRSLGS